MAVYFATMNESYSYFTLLSTLGIISLLNFSHSSEYIDGLVLSFISLTTDDFVHLFMYCLPSIYLLWWSVSSHIFASFSLGCLKLVELKEFFQIFWIQVPDVILQIFSPKLSCLFISCGVFLKSKHLSFSEMQLTSLSFMLCAFQVLFLRLFALPQITKLFLLWFLSGILYCMIYMEICHLFELISVYSVR